MLKLISNIKTEEFKLWLKTRVGLHLQGGGVRLLVEKLRSLKVEKINNKKEITIQPFNHSTIKLRKQYAFTLAEVLITLGIIGIVAVLTLPNLMSDYRKKTYVAQLQRVYNQIQTAAQNCMADEDVDNLNDTYLRWHEPNTEDMNEDESAEAITDAWSASAGRFLKKYFRVTKDCGHVALRDDNDCIATSYKDIDGGNGITIHGYCVNVNTGSTICMWPFDGYRPAKFYVDTNGKSGPNTWGRDVFEFGMNYRGDIAEGFGYSEDRYVNCGDSDGYGCFDKIIADGWKMDY